MSTVRYYRWDDAGAPSLTGEVGSLTNLLRKCLVGTAGVAYGSKPAAGWTEEFAGTAANIAVFKNSMAAGGSECCVRINDNAPGGSGALEASVRVYEAMTDVNSGISALTDVWFRKSGTANTAARPWLVVADERTAWLFGWKNGEAFGEVYATSLLGFGDLSIPGGAIPFFSIGRSAAAQNAGGSMSAVIAAGASGGFTGMSVSDPAGVSGPFTCGVVPPIPASATGGIGGRGYQPISSPADPLIFQKPATVAFGNRYMGTLRGISLPIFNVGTTSAVVGSGMAESGDLILTRVHTVDGDVNWLAYLLVDSLGPWS